jgi:c-di-GMP-binding flagellar brake protein YcgR
MDQKRQYVRVDFHADVEILVGGNSQHGRTVNISQGGILVETTPLPKLDDKVVIRMDLPGVAARSEIACIVRWAKEPEGVGLQFENLRAIEVWALNKLLKSIQPK